MGLMQKFLINFSVFAGAIALITALINGVSIGTGLFRAGLVFLGTMLLFIVALHTIRWAIIATTIVDFKTAKNNENGFQKDGVTDQVKGDEDKARLAEETQKDQGTKQS